MQGSTTAFICIIFLLVGTYTGGATVIDGKRSAGLQYSRQIDRSLQQDGLQKANNELNSTVDNLQPGIQYSQTQQALASDQHVHSSTLQDSALIDEPHNVSKGSSTVLEQQQQQQGQKPGNEVYNAQVNTNALTAWKGYDPSLLGRDDIFINTPPTPMQTIQQNGETTTSGMTLHGQPPSQVQHANNNDHAITGLADTSGTATAISNEVIAGVAPGLSSKTGTQLESIIESTAINQQQPEVTINNTVQSNTANQQQLLTIDNSNTSNSTDSHGLVSEVQDHVNAAPIRSSIDDTANGAADNNAVTAAGHQAIPDKFNFLKPQEPVQQDILPTWLSSLYPRPTPQTSTTLEFHWVITSCNRHLWGRMLTSTIISGLANELKPKTTTIVWCKPYNKTAGMPSLLYNLRHSHSFNVMFMNEKEKMMRGHGIRALVTTMLVPTVLKQEHLPLLMTEDDVLFAPDANVRLAQAVSKLPPDVQQEPYCIQLYELDKIRLAPNSTADIPQPEDDAAGSTAARESATNDVPRGFKRYGAQGYLFSPAMTTILLKSMLKMQEDVSGPAPDRLAIYGQDVIIEDLLRRYKCNEPGEPCHYFRIKPNLLQHIGTSSSLFNHNGVFRNKKYHTSKEFPVRVAFPGFEPGGMW